MTLIRFARYMPAIDDNYDDTAHGDGQYNISIEISEGDDEAKL